jgi:transposase
MAPHQRKKSPAAQPLPAQRHAVNVPAAGIAVGAEAHWGAVPVEAAPQPVRAFPAHTASLHAVAAWLTLCGITTVALDSTGGYWLPLCEWLEPQGVEVMLVDPGTLPTNGRPKTDVHDGPWLQRLQTLGLRSAALRPDDPVVVLRSSLRLRLTLLADAARHIQHRQKALTQMHSKWPHVVSDRTGVTGLRLIKAMLTGARDPRRLAALRDQRCKANAAPLAPALHGTWREEHLVALQQAGAASEFCHQQIQECDAKIAAQLQTFEDRSKGESVPPKARKRHRTRFSCETRPLLHRMTGVDLTTIEGIDETTA